jgi:hypothetical protein
MIDYLYYKLYQASLKSSLNDIPQIAAAALLGCLLSANILVLNAFLSKITSLPFLFANSKQGGAFAAIVISIAITYFRKDKRGSILEKYSLESKEERIKGSTIVACYAALSFLLIFVVAFFKPGKL